MADASVIEHAFIYPPEIDWWLLGQAVEQYKGLGYKQVETPWVTPKQYMDGTKPHYHETFELHQGQFADQHHELVGSAEQGFVYMKARKMLPEGAMLMSVSPCFRVEQFDSLHLPWFMKLELFVDSTDPEKLKEVITDAFNTFDHLLGVDEGKNKLEVVQINDTFDIELNGIEIGSYGIRRHFDRKEDYIYGTGIALPRFTQARR